MLINRLDQTENVLQLEVCEAIQKLEPLELDRATFYEILLQREWVSYCFTPVYDIIQNRLSPLSITIKPTIRQIIQEEYPDSGWPPTGEVPSHREDLVTDLISMGVTEDQHRNSWFSAQTKVVMDESVESVRICLDTEFPDVALIAFLRFWGEVLTAVEYKQLKPRILMLLGSRPSRFYLPHIKHDEQINSLAGAEANTDSTTHADELGKHLARLISNSSSKSRAISCAEDSCKKAALLKVTFYAQFHQ